MSKNDEVHPQSFNEHAQSEKKARTKENIQFLMLFWALFSAGYNDGSTGPLLPRIQQVYNVGFTVVSMLFVANCIGFVSGAFANIWLNPLLGFGKTIALGSAIQTIGHAIQAAAPPFPVFALGYGISGFGIAVKDAQANGYVAAIKNHSAAKMGALHAAYGLGAFVAPLAATQFAPRRHWAFHFLVALGLALGNTVTLLVVFRGRSQEACLNEIGQEATEEPSSEQSHFRQIMSIRAVHLLAAFILVYVGVSVTIGGWIVTFLIEQRGGGSSAGYVSSGFFGGVALGRVALLWVNHKVGEWTIIFVYSLLAIGLEIVVWRVPSLVGNAVAVSIIGLVLGPMYPIAMNQAGRVIPRWVLTPSIGWIAGFGTTGGALLPFITGAIASKAGISALQPLLVGMMVVMLGLWALVPKGSRRVD